MNQFTVEWTKDRLEGWLRTKHESAVREWISVDVDETVVGQRKYRKAIVIRADNYRCSYTIYADGDVYMDKIKLVTPISG